MGFGEWTLVSIFALGILMGLIGWLLANKDAKQEETIKANKAESDRLFTELFSKHEEDVKKLTALEIDIAKNYNPKHEIASLFDGFKLYLNERFDRIEQAVGVERRNTQ